MGMYDIDTYTSDDTPGWRVVIAQCDYDPGAPHTDWDMTIGSHHDRAVINTWRPTGLPGASYVFRHWYTEPEYHESDSLREYLPTDGTVIGLDYCEGAYLRVSDSDDPADWDGYFHVTESQYRYLHEPDGHYTTDHGRTYTAREAFLRRVIAAECETVSAWITGDVYEWRLEREETWTNTAGETMTTWEYVDGCSGYYGAGEWPYMVETAWDSVPQLSPGEGVAAA